MTYSFRFLGPGFARGLGCPSFKALEDLLVPALAVPEAFFLASDGIGKAAASLSGELVLFSVLTTVVDGSSFGATAGVELDDDALDEGRFGAGLSCGHRDR